LKSQHRPGDLILANDRLENIFTINRPRRCAGSLEKYDPGNDVTDWPLKQRPAPSFEIREESFSFEYYQVLASMQREYLASPAVVSTASVLLVDDGAGNQVRVAIRSTKNT
jgi:hypothetical protein